MQKIASILSIIFGLFQIVGGALGLYGWDKMRMDTLTNSWETVSFVTMIVIGSIATIIGFRVWTHPRGFVSFLLLIFFSINVVLWVIYGREHAAGITTLVINAVGAGSILLGIIFGKNKS